MQIACQSAAGLNSRAGVILIYPPPKLLSLNLLPHPLLGKFVNLIVILFRNEVGAIVTELNPVLVHFFVSERHEGLAFRPHNFYVSHNLLILSVFSFFEKFVFLLGSHREIESGKGFNLLVL